MSIHGDYHGTKGWSHDTSHDHHTFSIVYKRPHR